MHTKLDEQDDLQLVIESDLLKSLTPTQLEYLSLLRTHAFIVVTEGSSYATFKVHNRQMHSSSFEALKAHKMIELLSTHKAQHLITSVYKISDKGLQL